MKKKGSIAMIAIHTVVWILLTITLIVLYSWSAVDGYVNTMIKIGGVAEKKIEGTIDYYTPKFSSMEEAYAHSHEVAIEAQASGSVLLENNGALPLAKAERNISVFGVASVNIAYGGTGSGEGNGGKNNVDLYTALENEGFTWNETLKNFYENKKNQGYRRGGGTDMNGSYFGWKGARDYGYSINEVEREAYENVRSSYADYSDAALIVISRSGGEGQDLPTSMRDFYEGDDKHYLQLTDEEIALFEEVKEGNFEKTVVLLNTLNPFEVGFLKDESFGVDAALWIGGPGQYGLEAVAKMLTGELAPEGRLSDTYAANLLSAPAMQNYGDNRYTENGVVTTAAYVAYAEGIYSGYRYYETRYFDSVKGVGNAASPVGASDGAAWDYNKEVAYPFGYGKGYTEFAWGEPSYTETNGKITVQVEVTNDGERTGREVVQLYAHKPYSANDQAIGVEKSAIDLVGYAKTKPLASGKGELVEIVIEKEQFASYDAYEKKTYRMDRGDYYLIVAKDAHEATESVLSGDKNAMLYEQKTDEVFSKSDTMYEITNRFETENYTSKPADMTMLSRSDWAGTWPKVYGDNGVAGKATKEFTAAIKAEILNKSENAHLGKNDDKTDYIYNTNTKQTEKITIGKAITKSGEGFNFIDMVDENGKVTDYYDQKWDKLVQCMSVEELYVFLSSAFGQTAGAESINKPRSITSDSPMGLGCGTLFPCYPIQSAAWDISIAEKIGGCIAEEGIWNDVRGWYSPTCNLHRIPFGGRNYEYYSEDGVLAGKYAATVVKNVQAGGMYVQIKHFAVNEQDTNRGDRGNFQNFDPYNGLCTYANEQSIREIYLKAFQLAVEEGGAHGVMTSYNRIGNTWSGGHYGLVTEILRNEWGMKGNALSDYAGTFGYTYMNMNQGLRAGNDIWLHPSNAFPIDDKTSDAAIYYMQKAAKNVLYAEAHTSRINNLRYADGSAVQVKIQISPWKYWVGSGYLALTALCAAVVVLSVKNIKKQQTK